MAKKLSHGVPGDMLPTPAKAKGKLRTAQFTKLTEGRNRKERRQIEKLNRGRS